MDINEQYFFNTPRFLEKPYSWVQHTPFALFLIEKLKPTIFVELGTHSGNSYFAFCQAVVELGLKTKCFAVDTWDGDEQAGFYGKEVYDRVAKINQTQFSKVSNLMKMRFEDALTYFSDSSIDLLHIDGFHTYEAVKNDFENWLPKMSKQGVILLHDINVRERQFGVWKLFDELKLKYPALEFLHGHGLGVVCCGKDVNPEFLNFVENANSNSFIQNLFSTLGKFVLKGKENEELNISLSTLKKSKLDKEEELKVLLSKVDGKEQAISILKKDLDGLKEQLNQERKQTDLLRQNVESEKLKTAQISEVVKQEKVKSKEFQDNLSAARSKIDQLEKDIQEGITKSVDLTLSLQYERKTSTHLLDEINNFQTEIKNLKDNLGKFTLINNDLTLSLQKEKWISKELQGKLTKQQKDIEILTQNLQHSNLTNSDLKLNLQSEKMQTIILQEKLVIEQRALHEIEKRLNQEQLRVTESERILSQKESHITILEAKINELSTSLNLLDQNIISLQGELNYKSLSETRKNAEINDLCITVDSLKSEIENLSEKSLEVETSNANLRLINEQDQKKIIKYENQISGYLQSILAQGSEIELKEKELNYLRSILLQREKELLLSDEREKDFVLEINRYMADNKENVTCINRLTHELQVKENAVLTLRDNINELKVLISNLENNLTQAHTAFETEKKFSSKLSSDNENLSLTIAQKDKQIHTIGESVQTLSKINSELNEKIQLLNYSIEENEKQLKNKAFELQCMYNSKSWRYTAPLRKTTQVFQKTAQIFKTYTNILHKLLFFNVSGAKQEIRKAKDIRIIKKSGKFDQKWYANTYSDIKGSEDFSILHYVYYGSQEGRNPCPDFNTRFYVNTYPDVKLSKINPFAHYILFGEKEGRKPMPIENRNSPKVIRETKEIVKKTEDKQGVKGGSILYIVHEGEGGMVLTSNDLFNYVDSQVKAYMLVTGNTHWNLQCSTGILESFTFNQNWNQIRDLDHEREKVLNLIIDKYSVKITHIRVLICNGSRTIETLKKKNIPVLFSFHDFSAICPNIRLLHNSKFCGGNCTSITSSSDCQYSRLWFGDITLRSTYKEEWVRKNNAALKMCDTLIVSSNFVKDVARQNFNDLGTEKFVTIEHGRDFGERKVLVGDRNREKWNILFLGYLNESKGASLVKEIMSINKRKRGKIRLHVLGKLDGKFLPFFKNDVNTIVHGEYNRENLKSLLENIKPVLTILPSIWPETFSHVLTESWFYGIPVLGTPYGAIGERIEAQKGGWILEPKDAHVWYGKINALLGKKSDYDQKTQSLADLQFKSIRSMGNEYLELYKKLSPSLIIDIKEEKIDVHEKQETKVSQDNSSIQETSDVIPSNSFLASIDGLSDSFLQGWVYDTANPKHNAMAMIYIDNQFVVEFESGFYRDDLNKAGIGDGWHSFVIDIPESWFDGIEHTVDIAIPQENAQYEIIKSKKLLFNTLPQKFHFFKGSLDSKKDKSEKKQSGSSQKQSILFVSHSFGHKMYGSERSFIDIINAANKEKYNIYVMYPKISDDYLHNILPYCNGIITYPYHWRKFPMLLNERVTKVFEDVIQNFKIDLLYVNTIMLWEPFEAAKRCNIPSTCNVRELISKDIYLQRELNTDSNTIISHVLEDADFIIANSNTTKTEFSKPSKEFVVHNCVDIDLFDIENSVNPERIYVGMIGNNIHKKGIFEFVELAKVAEAELPNIVFRLIGPMNKETEKIISDIEENCSPGNVEFMGYYNNPSEAVQQINICINFSIFAESFGRSVLESMAARRPSIVYDWGALPELVEHDKTGYIIPYMQPMDALKILKDLSANPTKINYLGNNARQKVVEKYSFNAMKQQLNEVFATILPINSSNSETNSLKNDEKDTKPLVSVIIPNYNYEHYLDERICSIVEQTCKDIEIIFLDDCSKDNSLKKAETIQKSFNVPFSIHPNVSNQGTYRQWQKGIEKAQGDFIWIAEADDSCEPTMLESLLAKMQDSSVVLAYCQSQRTDANGEITAPNNLRHTDSLDKDRWKSDYVEVGVREVVDFLSYRNTIPNVSACLFRKSALVKATKGLEKFRFCGDWLMYCNLLSLGDIAYISTPLNKFRRHSGSTTNSNNRSLAYLKELVEIKKQITDTFPIKLKQLDGQLAYLDKDYKIEGYTKNSDTDEVKGFIQYFKDKYPTRSRIAFLTTNNGSHNGGSEVLWNETVLYLRSLNHDVAVAIKKWEPAPPSFSTFRQLGVKIIFKDGSEAEQIVKFNPDLVVISTGDQDEGIEYFPYFAAKKIKYCIINQLTKQIEYWPVRTQKTPMVIEGYKNAARTFFTCWNNHRIMEQRLDVKINNADIHFNPFHFDRNILLPFPDISNGLRIAMPAKMLKIHKGQHLAIELFSKEKWRQKSITLNLYGDGPDKEEYQKMVDSYGLKNVKIHSRTPDILGIWKENHAILMTSFMEGLPIVLVGAMMCGRVPILTDIGGHKEVVIDNQCGFIASKPTLDDIDEALTRAVKRQKEWKEIGAKARQRILEYLPEDPVGNFAEKILKIVHPNQNNL
jgi:glycosyltransferase involved in cell wall biosynthesis/chromosome segregation ATPase